MKSLFGLCLLILSFGSAEAFGQTTKFIKECTVTSLDAHFKAKYTIDIYGLKLGNADLNNFQSYAEFAIVNYDGPYDPSDSSSGQVETQLGVYTVNPRGPNLPPGSEYYGGVSAGTLFELHLWSSGAAKLTLTDDQGKQRIMSTNPSAGSPAYKFSCK